MDELPSEAKSVLHLAKSAQVGVSSGTRTRVRARVEAAVAAGALSHSGRPPAAAGEPFAASKGFFTSTKVMLASGALLFGVGGALYGVHPGLALKSPSPVHAPAESVAKVALAKPAARAITDVTEAHSSVQPSAAPDSRPAANMANKPAESSRHALAAEVSLLSQAAEALAVKDVERARSMLNEHRRRFARPQLREERDGLSLLARCIEREGRAQDDALAFVSQRPTSVLAGQIRRACGLQDGS